MAVTKIHPIKTTLNLSIDYICDTNKTDEEIFISSNACGYKTAALEFQRTKEIMNSQCKNLARHLIQSFMPGEVSPEAAHQIGKDLCEKHLQNKYQYVLTTHVDKGHIHNHIIFNNVSFIDGKAYISNKRSYHQIRNISDELCKINGLSIATNSSSIQINNKTNGTSYKEYQERKKGNSYKAKLQYAIDVAIRNSKDWEDFLRILQSKGYEIKPGKHISFRAVDQERFTRSKTIGEDYSEEQIKERIASNLNSSQNQSATKGHSKSKVIDITTNSLAQESAGFARWLKLQNLKVMAKSWSSLTYNNVTDIKTFYKYISNVHDKHSIIQTEIKSLEKTIHDYETRMKNIKDLSLYSNVYNKYLASNNKEGFFQTHERDLILFEAAKNSLGGSITTKLLSSIPDLDKQVNKLNIDLQKHIFDLTSSKEEVSGVNQLRKNFDVYLRSEDNLTIEKSGRSS